MSNSIQIVFFVLQLVLLGVGWFLISYIRGLPDQLHRVHFEVFRNELAREFERLRIRESALQPQKMQESANLIRYMVSTMQRQAHDREFQEALAEKGSQESIEFGQKMADIGINLYLFGSDAAVKKWADWREYGQRPADQIDGMVSLIMFATLIAQIRKDMGHEKTDVGVDELMYTLLNDWGAVRNRPDVQAVLATIEKL